LNSKLFKADQLRIADCKYLWEPLFSHHYSEKKLQAQQIQEQQLAAVKLNDKQNSIYLRNEINNATREKKEE